MPRKIMVAACMAAFLALTAFGTGEVAAASLAEVATALEAGQQEKARQLFSEAFDEQWPSLRQAAVAEAFRRSLNGKEFRTPEEWLAEFLPFRLALSGPGHEKRLAEIEDTAFEMFANDKALQKYVLALDALGGGDGPLLERMARSLDAGNGRAKRAVQTLHGTGDFDPRTLTFAAAFLLTGKNRNRVSAVTTVKPLTDAATFGGPDQGFTSRKPLAEA